MKFNKEQLDYYLKYNPDTGCFIWINPTYPGNKAGDLAGTVDKNGYVVISINYKKHFAHRLAHLTMTGGWPDKDIDHRNGNPSDNRWLNLRPATKRQNMHNRKPLANTATGIKGVTYDKSRDKYLVRLNINGVNTNLGRYDDLELAELVITEARNKYHKEFARHE